MEANFTSDMSPYYFSKMGPLDVLAAVASATLRNEIIIPSDMNRKKYKNKEKSLSTECLSFEDIKVLPTKTLIETFSEVNFDKLTKKYSYKCILLPEKCAETYKSFGNEKKACDEIKSHLLSHLQQLEHEVGSTSGIINFCFESKPLLFKSKLCGKPVKANIGTLNKQHSPRKVLCKKLNSCGFLRNTRSNIVSNKQSQLYLENNKSARKLGPKKVENTILQTSCSVSTYSSHNTGFQSEPPEGGNDVILSSDAPKGVEDKVKKCDEENSKYCQDMNCGLILECDENDDANNLIENYLNPENMVPDNKTIDDKHFRDLDRCVFSSGSNSLTFYHDHSYASFTETENCPEILSDNKKFFSRNCKVTGNSSEPMLTDNELPHGLSFETEVCEIGETKINIESLCVINTPPFPFVHVPLLPEISNIEVIQIGEDFKVRRKRKCFSYLRYNRNKSFSKARSRCRAKFSSVLNKHDNSASVLECVENRVSMKPNVSLVKKGFQSTENINENLENMRKDEQEFAMECIQKLTLKKKKHDPESLMCEICENRNFTAMATLIHHYRSHAGIKPFSCKECNSKFTRQHSLNYHMLIHQNLSRFSCEFCKRTFRHPSHYKEHLRRHTGETPYHCTDCSSQFKTRNTFKRHLKTHHGKLLTAQGVEDLTAEEFSKLRTSRKSKKQ